MTTEDLADYPPTSCWSCSESLTDEETSAVDGAPKESQLCAVCIAEQAQTALADAQERAETSEYHRDRDEEASK